MKKQLTVLLLCMALLIGCFPLGAFKFTASAADTTYKTENVEVPMGWDYIEVATAQELTDALGKHVWYENHNCPQAVFIRLTADISVSDASMNRNSCALIFESISNSTTIDFNGHTIRGKISALNNQDNKTWSLLNIRLMYGAFPDFTFRMVDSVGGGGITLDAETYIDGPTNAVCIHTDELTGSAVTEGKLLYAEDNVNVIIDGGIYKLNTRNQKFTTVQLNAYATFTDSAGKPCWNFWTPFTRSAVGVTGCRTTINNGHFTAINYIDEDDAGTVMGNRYVSALGLGDYYSVGCLRINGGTFDGSAYAVFFCNSGSSAWAIPKLNGGFFEGGIMICSLAGTWWKKTKGQYDLDDKLKKEKVSKAMLDGAVMYLDGKRVKTDETTLETIGWPHTIRIESAPEITSCKVANPIVMTGQEASATLAFNKTPDSLEIQKLSVKKGIDGRLTKTWGTMAGAHYHIYTKAYRIELPASATETTEAVRVVAHFGDTEIISETMTFKWVKVPDYQFTLQPVSQTIPEDTSIRIPFDCNFKDKVKWVELRWLNAKGDWSDAAKWSYLLGDESWIAITGSEVPGATKMTYQFVIAYEAGLSEPKLVCSDEFTVTWVEKTSDNILYGDVDGENGVTAADARLALRASVKLEALTARQEKAADVDGVAGVSAADARLILRYAVKLESVLPVK